MPNAQLVIPRSRSDRTETTNRVAADVRGGTARHWDGSCRQRKRAARRPPVESTSKRSVFVLQPELDQARRDHRLSNLPEGARAGDIDGIGCAEDRVVEDVEEVS